MGADRFKVIARSIEEAEICLKNFFFSDILEERSHFENLEIGGMMNWRRRAKIKERWSSIYQSECNVRENFLSKWSTVICPFSVTVMNTTIDAQDSRDFQLGTWELNKVSTDILFEVFLRGHDEFFLWFAYLQQ